MFRASRTALKGRVDALSPLELFTKVQLGATPTQTQTRSFLVTHFSDALSERGLTDNRLAQFDNKKINDLLKQVLFERYLSVPFTVLSFDLEFTSTPRFTPQGPTEDIIELGLYAPDSGKRWSRLIKPGLLLERTPQVKKGVHSSSNGVKQPKVVTSEVEKLTGITNELLAKCGVRFDEAWSDALNFIDEQSGNNAEARDRVLLLSHGGKLADVSMLRWATSAVRKPIPPTFIFGDTFHTVRDLHRRRPVTKDKMPPSWGLADLGRWLKLDVPEGFVAPTNGPKLAATPIAKRTKSKAFPTPSVTTSAGSNAKVPKGAVFGAGAAGGSEAAAASAELHGATLHRAAVDAQLTWDVVYHSLDRYGEGSLTPRQQLVGRFFDDAGKAALSGRLVSKDSAKNSVSAELGELDFMEGV